MEQKAKLIRHLKRRIIAETARYKDAEDFSIKISAGAKRKTLLEVLEYVKSHIK